MCQKRHGIGPGSDVSFKGHIFDGVAVNRHANLQNWTAGLLTFPDYFLETDLFSLPKYLVILSSTL